MGVCGRGRGGDRRRHRAVALSRNDGWRWQTRAVLRLLVSLITLAMVLVACSSNDTPTPRETQAPSTEAPLLPGADIVLESVTFGDDVITFKPVGWEYDEELGAATPLGSTQPGQSWTITDACLGECLPRSSSEWAGVVTSSYAEVAPSQAMDVVREITGDDSYLLELVSTEGHGELVYVRWVEGAPQAIVCTAMGPFEIIDQLFAALEFACDNTRAALDGD